MGYAAEAMRLRALPLQMFAVKYDDDEEEKKSSGGYGRGKGYSNRETAFTWKDGTTTYSNATNYLDAAKEAGKEGVGLSRASTYSTKNGEKTGFTNSIYSNDGKSGTAYYGSSGYDISGGYVPVSGYLDRGMSAEDRAALEAYARQYVAAQQEFTNTKSPQAYNAMEAAHAAAEALRKQYGYSGGTDGSEYIPIDGQQNLPYGRGFYFGYDKPVYSFDVERPSAYSSPYSAQMSDILNQILNRDAFSYDVNSDPLYSQYKSQYLREGQRAMNDTLASAAAGAGGMNSYALSAAQQAQNYYDAQLGDKIPQLYQMAYDMYLSDIDNKVRDFGLLEGLDSTEYGRYRDTMSDWYNDRDFAYNRYRDDVGDYYTDRDFSYNQYRDSVSDQRYDQEWNYSREQESRDTAYSQAMQLLAAGVIPSDELLSRAGISRSEARSYLNGGDVISSPVSVYSGTGNGTSGTYTSGANTTTAKTVSEDASYVSSLRRLAAESARSGGESVKRAASIIVQAMDEGKIGDSTGEELLDLLVSYS